MACFYVFQGLVCIELRRAPVDFQVPSSSQSLALLDTPRALIFHSERFLHFTPFGWPQIESLGYPGSAVN